MKTLLAILIVGFLGFTVHAQITAGNPELDQFAAYTAGQPLTNFTNPNGTKWITFGNGTVGVPPTISSGSLTVPGLLNPSGNAVTWGSSGAGSSTACAVLPLTGKTQISGNTPSSVFYSMAFRMNAGTIPASQLFVAGFVSTANQTGSGSPPTVIAGRLYIKTNSAAAGSYSIGINKADGTALDTVYESATYTVGTTYFIVVEYTFSGTENGTDIISMWVNPATSTFGAASPPTGDPSYVSTAAGTDVQAGSSDVINGFELRQVNSLPGSMTMDELSIGVTWKDVTPLQPGPTPTFTGLTASPSTVYGTTFALSGQVVATGPVYPAMGEGVTVTINGVTESTTINDATGDFTINYTKCNAPVGGGPYPITYGYAGSTLSPATDSTTSLTITGPLAVVLSGSRLFDGTANAATSMLYVSNTITGDVVTVSGGSATLTAATVGLEPITSETGMTLGGAAAGNYTLTGVSGAVNIVAGPFATVHPDYEPFADASGSGGTTYSVGANLAGQTNSQGLPWFAAGTGASQPTIFSGNLTIPGLATESGNSAMLNGASGTSARLDLGAATNNSTVYGGSAVTVYYSMAFQVNFLGSLTTTPSFVCGFNNNTGAQSSTPTTFAARLYTRLDGSGYDLGINKMDGVAGDIQWESTTYATSTPYFVVAAYSFSGTPGATNDTVSLWVNPSSSTFGAGSAPAADLSTSAGTQLGTTSTTDEISSFILRESTSLEPGTMIIDALRFGMTWADVTPPPFQITSVHLDNTGNNLVITWQSVAGVQYHVTGTAALTNPKSGWTTVPGTAVTATGGTASVTFPIPTTPPMNYFNVVSP